MDRRLREAEQRLRAEITNENAFSYASLLHRGGISSWDELAAKVHTVLIETMVAQGKTIPFARTDDPWSGALEEGFDPCLEQSTTLLYEGTWITINGIVKRLSDVTWRGELTVRMTGVGGGPISLERSIRFFPGNLPIAVREAAYAISPLGNARSLRETLARHISGADAANQAVLENSLSVNTALWRLARRIEDGGCP